MGHQYFLSQLSDAKGLHLPRAVLNYPQQRAMYKKVMPKMVEISINALSAARSTLLSEDDPLLTPKDVVAYLRSLGLPISPS